MNIRNIFDNILKGDQGEIYVFNAINRILNNNGTENYYLVPRITIDDISGGSREIDLLLLHPILGIYVIEIKNWSSLNMINDTNNPYNQVKIYHRMLLAKIEKALGKIPINIEYRVIFPSILRNNTKEFYKLNPNYINFQNHTFFKDDLKDKEIFANFFNSSVNILPNKKEFLKISKLLISKNKIEKNKVISTIAKSEVVFFDHKQLSIMNGYTSGFRIIRGVAGTGKTTILLNFIANKIKRDKNEKFLVLCFNKNLSKNIKSSFEDSFLKTNIIVYTIIGLLKRINFDVCKVGISDDSSLDEMYKIYESDKALDEFRIKFRIYLAKYPVNYVLCDETQDMPAGFMRIIYEEINDCIFFIDEAQKFYSYTMDGIVDIFRHSKFERIDMRGRVKNLKNVYRTPCNIAKCAFEILEFDKAINNYYKKSYYLNNSFLVDIECVLQSGNIKICDIDDFDNLRQVLDTLPNNESSIVLSSNTKSVDIIKTDVVPSNKNINVMTIQSIKGLEAQNIIIHNFLMFMKTVFKYDKNIFYRKIYVLLTRSKESLYISLPNEIDDSLPKEIKDVIFVIKKHSIYI